MLVVKGVGVLVNPLTKVNSSQKIFFSDNVEYMISDDVKANTNQQEIKNLVAASYNFL